MDKLQYSLEMYEDHALISGAIACDVLDILIKFCKLEGFTHLTIRPDGKPGFMLVKK
jgi:hypothetical protein